MLIAGLAGMVGSALSTGTGAYLTARSEREIYEAGIARERHAVDYDESESREVLALSLQVRGLPEDVADRLSHLLAEDREGFVKALARTRGNASEENLSSPWVAALTGFAATGIGCLRPHHPILLLVWGFSDRHSGRRLTLSSLRSWCYKISHDRTLVVGLGPRVSYIRSDGRDRYIFDWRGSRPTGWNAVTALESRLFARLYDHHTFSCAARDQ